MTREEVLNTYDQSYAKRYNNTFLINPKPGSYTVNKTRFETVLLKRLTRRAASWLDVACGTGYFLKHGRGSNPNIECAGLDISPAMLGEARCLNPDMCFIEADFLSPQPTFIDRWELTTCMWGAYCLQETLADVEALVGNMAKWTKPNGKCFTPVFDLTALAARRDGGSLMEGVEFNVEESRWTFAERDGKVHRNMLAPSIPTMIEMFENSFGSAETINYPGALHPFIGIIGIIARKTI
ncbi:MAG: class I SAM-dependent methyltransferase [Blastocatellia bacterium]